MDKVLHFLELTDEEESENNNNRYSIAFGILSPQTPWDPIRY